MHWTKPLFLKYHHILQCVNKNIHEEHSLLGCNAMQWRGLLPTLGFFLSLTFNTKDGAIYSSEMLGSLWTTWFHCSQSVTWEPHIQQKYTCLGGRINLSSRSKECLISLAHVMNLFRLSNGCNSGWSVPYISFMCHAVCKIMTTKFKAGLHEYTYSTNHLQGRVSE
jgi:hypothetical protein